MDVKVLHENVSCWLATSPIPEKRATRTTAMGNMGLDERLRYSFDAKFGGLRGAARESTFRGSKQTRSFADAQAIEAAIASGGLLLAKEHTHLAVIRNARDSAIIPLYASGTAKVKGHGAAGDQAWMLEKLEEVWVEKVEPTRGPLVVACLDNDSTNSETLKRLYESRQMPAGPLRDAIEALAMMDTCSNANGTVGANDDQHDGKNDRGRKASSGGFGTDTIHFDREELIDVIHHTTGASKAILETYFPPPNTDDHQNVDKMVKGMIELAKLKGKTISDLPLSLSQRYKASLGSMLLQLQPLAIIAGCWETLFTDNKASLADHLTNLSTMAHVAFVIMRHQLPKGCPPAFTWQTYKGIQRSIRAHFIAVIRAQLEGDVEDFYLFLNATHLLEVLFGIKRTLVGAQRGLDSLQDEERTSTVVVIRYIQETEPDLVVGSRRLTKSFDHWNTRSWLGDVKVARVTTVTVWHAGRSISKDLLARYCPFYLASEYDFDAIATAEPNATLMFPKGQHIAYIDDDDPAGETVAPTGNEGAGDDGEDDSEPSSTARVTGEIMDDSEGAATAGCAGASAAAVAGNAGDDAASGDDVDMVPEGDTAKNDSNRGTPSPTPFATNHEPNKIQLQKLIICCCGKMM